MLIIVCLLSPIHKVKTHNLMLQNDRHTLIVVFYDIGSFYFRSVLQLVCDVTEMLANLLNRNSFFDVTHNTF